MPQRRARRKTVGAGIPAPGIHGAPGTPRGARGRFRLPVRRDFDGGCRRRGDVPLDGDPLRGRRSPILARRRGCVGFTQEGTRLLARRGRDLQGDVADPRGSLRFRVAMFLLQEIQGSRIADQEPPLATELRGRLDDGRFSERRLQLRGGRKVQFFLGPEVEGQRAEDQIRTGPRAGGSFTLHRHARFRGGGNLRLRFPDGRGGRLRGGGEEPVEGQIHLVLPRLRRFQGGGGRFRAIGFRRPGGSREGDQVPDRGRGARDSRRRNPAPRSRGRRNRPRPAPEGRERERRP